MTIVDALVVCGGVDTHADFHVAAVLDHLGGVLGVASFEATAPGYHELLGWLYEFGSVLRIGVEGTGSYGAGLARFLHDHHIEVVEVDRPNRQLRHRRGKSDPTDAVAAARAALSGQATGIPKLRNGPMEQMRVLLVARRSARDQRIETLNQIRHLVFTAPEPIRARFLGRYHKGLVAELAGLRPRNGTDSVRYVTLVTLRDLARRIVQLDEERARIRANLHALVAETAPSMLDIYGMGPENAAELLVAASNNPQRIRSEAAFAHLCGVAPIEASSGKTIRYRLNRGGNRQANAALYRIVLTRMSSEPRTRSYVTRRRDEGLATKEIIRVLKRYVAREVYKHLPRCGT